MKTGQNSLVENETREKARYPKKTAIPCKKTCKRNWYLINVYIISFKKLVNIGQKQTRRNGPQAS